MSKGIKVKVDLDFTAANIDKESINKQINTAIDAVKINLDPQSAKKFESELKELGGVLERHLDESAGKINSKGLVADLNNRENFAALDELGNRYASVGIQAQESFNKVRQESGFLNESLKESDGILQRMGTTLTNTIRWNISASIVNSFSGAIQETYYYAKDLDRVLNDIRIVTGHSKEKMDEFAVAANEAARELSVSTIDYAEAATLFYQQGFNDTDVQNMTEAAVMASKITGTATEEMSNLLTSTLNGYRMATDEILQITDKFAAIGATTASSFDEIAVASSKVASMGSTAGVTIDQLSAQIATIMSVTRQAPETVGTSLKTIYGRMLAFKSDADAIMKDADGELFGAPKVEEALQAYNKVAGTQISLFRQTADGKKELRDLGEVIEEIGNSWDRTNDKQAKFALTTALAGSRQQNNLVALFDSWEMYQDAVLTSMEAEGTTLEQHSIYLESYEGKLASLQAAKESLFGALTDSDSMKGFIGGMASAVDLAAKLVENMGGLSGVAGVALALMSDNLMRSVLHLKENLDLTRNLSLEKANLTDKEREHVQIMGQLQSIANTYGKETAENLRLEMQSYSDAEKTLLKKQDILHEEEALLRDITEQYEKLEDVDKRRGRSLQMIRDAQDLGGSVENAQRLVVTYEKLAEAKERLAQLESDSIGADASDAIHHSVEAAAAEVESLEAQIASIKDMAAEASTVAEFEYRQAVEGLNDTREAIERQAQTAEKAEKVNQGLRTVFMLLPGAISTATDSSKGYGDILLNIGRNILPMMIMEVTKLIPALAAATSAAEAFNIVLGVINPTTALAVAGIALFSGALKFLNNHTKSAENALRDFKTAQEEAADVRSNYDQVVDELDQIKDRLLEINLIENRPDIGNDKLAELREEKEHLSEKLRYLEQEERIQENLLRIAEMKAASAAAEAFNSSFDSEFYYGGGGELNEVDYEEELARATAAYEKNTEAIERNKQKLAELKMERSASGEVSSRTERKVESLTNKIREQEEAQIDIAGTINQTLNEINEYKEAMAQTDMYDNEIKKIEELTDATLDWMDISLDDRLYDGADAADEASDALGFLSGEIDHLGDVQADTVDQLGDIVAEYEAVTDAMAQMEEQGYINLDTYLALIEMSEDYIGVMDMEEEAVFALLNASGQKAEASIQNSIDEKRQVIQDTKDEIEALQRLLTALATISSALGRPFGNKGTGGIGESMVVKPGASLKVPSMTTGLPGLFGGKAYDVLSTQLDDLNKSLSKETAELDILLGKQNAMKNYSAKKSSGPSKRSGGGGGGGRSKSKRPSRGGSKGGSRGSRGSSARQREEYKAEADLYAEINQLLAKNNALTSINKARRDQLIEGSAKYVKSLEEESVLLKTRQKQLHTKNEIMRAEGAALQKELSGIFNFEGSWADNSITITNMEAIAGKSKETEEKFKRLVKIMEDLPQASTEWHKINKQLEDIEIEKFTLKVEKLRELVELSARDMKHLEFDMDIKGPEEFINKAEVLVRKIEETDALLKETTITLGELRQKGFKPGSRAAEELRQTIMELETNTKEYKATIAATKRELEELNKMEQERIKQEWVDAQNKKLQKHREEVEAIREAQDVIVEIIRKRGEEEMRLLDEAHQAALDRLQKEQQERQKQNQKELDGYRKLIMDKIAALDEAYREEDYREQLLKEQEEANRLQKEIDILSLDDSLTAKNKRVALQEQLHAQIEKIEKMQRDKSREDQKKALMDELKDYEDQAKDKEDIENDRADRRRERLQDRYERKRKLLEEEYSNSRVYAEAAEALMTGQVEVAKGVYEDIATAHRNFQNEFGEGMGLLGDIIQDQFLKPLRMAEDALNRMNRIDLSKAPRDDYTIDDYDDSWLPEHGYTKPRDPDMGYEALNRPEEFRNPLWSTYDFRKYVNNKERWKHATSEEERARLNKENADLRERYWGAKRRYEDRYSIDELRGYKDGGVIDKSGLFVGHGSDQSSEVVFSAKTAKKLWEHIEKMPDLSTVMPQASVPNSYSRVLVDSGDTNLNFHVEGNLDRSILPEVEKMVRVAIKESDRRKKTELNKIGQFRLI